MLTKDHEFVAVHSIELLVGRNESLEIKFKVLDGNLASQGWVFFFQRVQIDCVVIEHEEALGVSFHVTAGDL